MSKVYTKKINKHISQTNTDHHIGDLNVCFLLVVSFTRFKWLTFKELI